MGALKWIMPQAFLIANPRFRVFDANGAPLAGGKINTYASGTSTPKVTYSQSDQGAENTNPIILDAAGECDLWLPEGELFRFVVTDADDVQQYDISGIEAITAPEPAPAPPDPVPTGTCVWSPYSTVPTGYLACDGSAVSRSTYSDLDALASADSYPNGNGDGSSTFNLPDLRGRAPYGLAASGTGSTLGGTFGAIDHVHSGPSHTHDTTVPRDGWGSSLNNPATTGRLDVGNASGTGEFSSAYQPTGDQTVTSAAGGTADTGSANPPGLAGYWFIKT